MYNLIRSECYRLRKTMAVKVILAIMLGGGILMSVFSSVLSEEMRMFGLNMSGANAYLNSLADSALYLILGCVFAGLFLCSGFEYRNIQDSISSGAGRGQILISKVIAYYFVLFLAMIPYCLIFTCIMTAVKGFGMAVEASLVARMALIFITTYVRCAAISTVTVLFAFTIQKSGAVIGIGIGVIVFGTSLLQAIGQLVPAFAKLLEFTPLGGSGLVAGFDVAAGDYMRMIVISLIYIVILVAVTYGCFRRAELK